MFVLTGVTNSWSGASNIRAVDSREVKCFGETDAKIVVRNIPLQLRVIVLDKLVAGIDVILGLDAVDWLEGSTIAKSQVDFERGNEIPEVTDGLTKGELFSVCRKLVGHYPRVRWLWIVCSFIKRQTSMD